MLINCTPHPLSIHAGDQVISIAPSGIVPRCAVVRIETEPIDGIPTCRSTMGAVVGLPDPVDGVFLIVSGLVLEAARSSGRTDLRNPGEVVRDSEGKIVGCRRTDLRSPGEAVRDSEGKIVGCKGLCS